MRVSGSLSQAKALGWMGWGTLSMSLDPLKRVFLDVSRGLHSSETRTFLAELFGRPHTSVS